MFARYPEQYDWVCNDPSLAVPVFEEAVRLLSPLQTILRTSKGDAELGGLSVRADHKIIISNAAANHDPRKFQNPERFDVKGNLGFGFGVHSCVGMHMAKLEAENLLQVLAERVKSISLTGGPTYKLNNTIRSLASLPISVELN